jgi:hypothetical protein
MINLFFDDEMNGKNLILSAFVRSFTKYQVNFDENLSLKSNLHGNFFVFSALNGSIYSKLDFDFFLNCPNQKKIIIFGVLPEVLRNKYSLGANVSDFSIDNSLSSEATPGQPKHSELSIRYTNLTTELNVPMWNRYFERFDFSKEWNNHGYGPIRVDNSIWGISEFTKIDNQSELGKVFLGKNHLFTYSAIFHHENNLILWFNRPAGPIDSFEWRIVENFISSFLHERFPCLPVLNEVPWGHDAAITSRLDCDEDVDSANHLFEIYKRAAIPFSLAVTTINLSNPKNHGIIKSIFQGSGSILSHSDTHPTNWGGNYENALNEIAISSDKIKSITGAIPKYAVSPFHQTPLYAIEALSDYGYDGCIGGLSSVNPEFLLARGGVINNTSFVGHSQQCMLHGDCLGKSDPLMNYKIAFDYSFSSMSLFGYLDHPFSERYSYGWKTENLRSQVHLDFINYIKKVTYNPIFISEDDALNFIKQKDDVLISWSDNTFNVIAGNKTKNRLSMSYEYKFKRFEVIA